MSEHTALITGITGQDGFYLSRHLLNQGYCVHGIRRRSNSFPAPRPEPVGADAAAAAQVHHHIGDLLDPIGLRRIISNVQPTEVYNLAAQSHVQTSFEDPIYTATVVAMGTLNLLEAIRDYRDASGREVKFYQASSSEMFGKASETPQSESTPFRPRNPYACAKVHAYWQTVNYREAYGLFACNGILYNHESPRRGENYVTRKITRAAARIKLGLQERLVLGNLDAERDWGFAGDYVLAMWQMLQQAAPDDYVVATGRTHSVRDLLNGAFGLLGLDWHDYVCIDERLLRPVEPTRLCGDASRARRQLGWQPRVSFATLVHMMVEADLAAAEREQTLLAAGYTA
ncbi:MAG: GDP-mannose 4,6-dehydratase [Planctomycetes bacterium]|nr:GDP-mannose 4,6-dehydratase [Planctomycetota bacterium]